MPGKLSRFTAHIQPNARRSEVTGFLDGKLRIKISAPPAKGRANREMIRLLSEVLGVSRSNISIERGKTSKTKIVAIEGMTQTAIRDKLGSPRPGARNGT